MSHEFLTTNIATTFLTRLLGLIGRSSLPDGEGFIIPRCAGIHTWFMRFPIDVVWLDSENKIVGVEKNLPPWRVVRGPKGTMACLELAAGGVKRHGMTLGTSVITSEKRAS